MGGEGGQGGRGRAKVSLRRGFSPSSVRDRLAGSAAHRSARTRLTRLTSRRAITDPNTIDLHGLTLAHALKIVDEATNSWWANARDCTSIRSASRTPSSDSFPLPSRLHHAPPHHRRRRPSLAQQHANPRSSRHKTPRQARLAMEVGRRTARRWRDRDGGEYEGRCQGVRRQVILARGECSRCI